MREIRPDVVIIYKEQKSAVAADNRMQWQNQSKGTEDAGEISRLNKELDEL